MKFLFKNSFFSFLSSKVAMILLSIIIFLSSTTFTLLNSTSNSFQTSYSSVVGQGQLHDFIVKEKYSFDGDVEIEPQAGTSVNREHPINLNNVITNQYIYFKNTDVQNKISIFNSVDNKTENSLFRIKRDTISFVDSNQDGTLDTIVPVSGSSYSIQTLNPWTLSQPNFQPASPIPTNYATPTSWSVAIDVDGTLENIKQDSGSKRRIFRLASSNLPDFVDALFNYLKSKNVFVAEQFSKINFRYANATSSFKSYLDALPQNQFDAMVVRATKSINPSEQELYIKTSDLASVNNDPKQVLEVQKVATELRKIFEDDILNDLSKTFTNNIDSLYGQNGTQGHKLEKTNVRSTLVPTNGKQFKVVNGIKDDMVDKMVLFEGQMPSKSLTSQELLDRLNTKAQKESVPNNATLIMTKGFRYEYVWYKNLMGNLIPSSLHVIDPTAFEAVINYEYFLNNKLSLVSPREVEEIMEQVFAAPNEFEELHNIINAKYANSVIWMDNTPYFITGVGTTPDFAFPIIDGSNPIPNGKTQGILFTNENGYNRIYDAFRNNQHEDYLAYKFVGTSSSEQSEILKNIEEIASNTMSWGQNVNHIVSLYNDTSETIILAPQRIAFLQKLKDTISTFSYLTTSMLILFSGLVTSLVIKKQINSKRKNLGILLANGYQRKEIAFANTSIALIIASISTLTGYIFGHYMQNVFINLFASYWTIPVHEHNFSWLALILTTIIPIVCIGVLAFAVTLWEMRSSIINILSGSNSSASRSLSAKILGPMKFMGIKTKASLSLLISNASKVVMLFIASTATITALSMSISTIDKFNYAKASSLAAKSYEYELELVSPTTEGGLTQRMDIDKLGMPIGSIDDIFSQTQDLLKPATVPFALPSFHTPSSSDANNQFNPKYLDNHIQFKSLLNVFMGLGNMGSNTWTTASSMMPENQLNIANEQAEKFMQFAANLPDNATPDPKSGNALRDGFGKMNNGTYIFDPTKAVSGLIPSVKNDYLKFLFNGLKASISEYIYNENIDHIPFFISYRNIIMNSDDELFTYIDSNIKLETIHSREEIEKIRIKGIDENSQNIILSKDAINSLKNASASEIEIPVIANEYFLAKYKLSIGDNFPIKVQNHKDRYKEGSKGLWTQDAVAKIVGKQNTYSDSQLYTLNTYANQALGWNANDKVFNGVYTKHKNSILFKSLSLYSQSGLYPSTDTLSKDPNNKVTQEINKYLASPANKMQSIQNIDDFVSTYSNSPYVMAYSNVNWEYSDAYRFDNIFDISSKLVYLVEGMVIFLTVLFIVIISFIMISDNKYFIATMKVMGYRNSEISKIFFTSLLPSLLLGLICAIPISIGLIFMMKVVIMSFGSILVPLSLSWWIPIVAFSLVFVGMSMIYWFSSHELRNTSLLHAFS